MHQTKNFSLCCVGRFIYLVGGGDKVRAYHPFIKEWSGDSVHELSQPRKCPCVCTVDNKIVVVDGDYEGDFASYEIIAASKKSTKFGTVLVDPEDEDEPLPVYSGIVGLENKIYAVGDSAMKIYDLEKGTVTLINI